MESIVDLIKRVVYLTVKGFVLSHRWRMTLLLLSKIRVCAIFVDNIEEI